MEDSIIINQGAIDRGFYNGCKFTFYKTELEQREEFGNPDATNTADIKSACYDKLVNGIIKKGTIVNKNDAIIGKYMKLTNRGEGDYLYADRSVIYKDDESAIVYNVIVDRNEDDERFCKVSLRKLRACEVGDKFCILPTAELLTDKGWVEMRHLNTTEHKVATLTLNGNIDYVYPSGLTSFNYNGEFYYIKTQQIHLECTRNHKLYVKRRNHTEFELLETHKVFGKRVQFKKWANNANPDVLYYNARDINGNIVNYSMDAWLKLLGIWIADGYTSHNEVVIVAKKQRKKNFHIQLLTELNVEWRMDVKKTYISKYKYPAIYNSLAPLSVGAINKKLPDYVWNLSQRQSRVLLNALLEGDGWYNINSAKYCTSSNALADDISKLAFHCGWSGNIKLKTEAGTPYAIATNGVISSQGTTNANHYTINIIKSKNEPMKNHPEVIHQNAQEEKYYYYNGLVYGIEIPDTHQAVYYMRESKTSPPCFTGNSSRSGEILPQWHLMPLVAFAAK